MTISGASRPGEIDLSFDPGFGVTPGGNSLNALVLQDDGKLIIGGGFTNYNGTAVANIARLNPDGSLDTNYLGSGGGIGAMQCLADGKLLVGGHFSEFGGLPRDQIAELNADGSVDQAFVPQGGFKGYYPQIFALAVQSDGKIIAGGTFELTSVTNVNMVRLRADGSVDPGFSVRNLGSVLALAVQPDGKIILGGTFGIRRVNAGGTPDASFGPVSVSVPPATTYSVSVSAIHLYQDGRILIGGYFARVNGEVRNNIARLTSAGVLDAGFDPGTGADGRIRALVVEPDGQIIVGGSFSNFNAFPRINLARLLPGGTLDLGFRCDVEGRGLTNVNPYFLGVNALALQPDGKIVIEGTFQTVNGIDRPGIARIFAGDSTEDAPRILSSPVDWTVSEGTNLTLMVNFDGVPYPRVWWLLNGTAMAGQSGNTLLLHNVLRKDAGDYTVGLSNNMGVVTGLVARLSVVPASTMPGAADVDFDPGEALLNPGSVSSPPGQGLKSSIRALAVQPDGAILAAGRFSTFDGAPAKGLVRLDRHGSLDNAFLSNAIVLRSDLQIADDILVQSDGRILVAGNYSYLNGGSERGRLSRLNADGTVDASFIESVEADYLGGGFRLAQRPDGKILLSGGSFYFNVGGQMRRRLALLNPDGSLDPAFNPDAGIIQGQIVALCIQNDGRALVGGSFETFNGVPQKNLVRLTMDGNLDASFAIGSGPDGWIHALRVQPDGRVLVGGGFTAFAGVSRNNLARLLADGGLDTSFDPGANIVGTVQAIDLQPDGKILVAGGGYIGSGRQTNNVVRLLPEGSLDPTFDARTDDVVYDLVRLNDGRIAVGGAFSRLDNVLRNGIAVLLGDPLLMNPSRTSESFRTVVKTISGRTYRLEYRSSWNEDSWTPVQESVGNGGVMTLIDPSPNSPQRFYRVRMD
jgi:uncharacterized delta-60 repeat protein